MKKVRKIAIKSLAFCMATSLLSGVCVSSFADKDDEFLSASASSAIRKTDAPIDMRTQDYFDSSVVYKLPDTVSETQELSVIVNMHTDALLDVYATMDTSKTASEYVNSAQAKKRASAIDSQRNALIKKLKASGVKYTLGEEYDTVLSGFEITIKAKDFQAVGELFRGDATLIIGETYLPADSQVITNDVDVYETGIFDTSNAEYQGDGVVVAVLDSGLDYTHSAFSVNNFTTTTEAFTLSNVSAKVSQTSAAKFTAGLKGEDVYLNKKIPFAYDYADKDTDVLPTNSEHGTHVSGIIAGKDDRITGVAPNAQLAFMKVFSDLSDGAKSSWLIAALEDCVTLGVDVVNMSLGAGCGFAREEDNKYINEVYDNIRNAGISLVVSAGNANNSAVGSEKNGNLGLTSNPDTGTVGSPSTYAASMSVASVDGVKTPYLVHNGEIIYFREATNSAAETKDFVDEILKTKGDNVQSFDFEYVAIPGIGRSADYPEEASFYAGKIVLVKRGETTFEDKVHIALKEKGAAGIIIYNNVSGDISMSVGHDVGAVCSISQDEGEKLAAAGSGIISINRSQVAGPFMSDFSSWGPTSDLQIKPEITAHGGEILSAVPGQDYDVQSGTSMAAPNQAGATALIRQYVKYSGVFGTDLTTNEITSIVNQLMMSTTDIVRNKNGLPYAVRKQGSGLVNILKATTAEAYLTTFNKDGSTMDKTKLELGDDKDKTGVYDMKFAIHNISGSAVAYEVSSVILTEGVSETYTSHSEQTVTQDGYLLSGTTTTVTAVDGGSYNGNTVTVGTGGTATVSVRIVLSDADKAYMNKSFANGMYVEGFIKLTSDSLVNLNVPMLAFYGDWTQAPIFDEEYYDTNKDELNKGLDVGDKLMADSYATRAIGGLYTDYIATLGSYYFEQDPSATPIAADKEHIAISNQKNGMNSSINALRYVWAGLLRNAKEANITIVEDSTGKKIFDVTDYNIRKSYSNGGNTIYSSSIEIEFDTLAHELKNNTKYTVTVTTYLDYCDKDEQSNARNVFQFPMYIDFEAPTVTDVSYRAETDKATKKTKLFADVSIYDNHYAMGMQVGQIVINEDPESIKQGYKFSMNTFGKYMTPVYSSYNSTSKVTIELTDYVSQLKKSAGIVYHENGTYDIVEGMNSFIVSCYDYAMNSATYEINLPDDVLQMYFSKDEIRLSPNETLDISTVLNVFPNETWIESLEFVSSDKDIVEVVNKTILAKESGTATITAIGYDENGVKKTDTVTVKVLAEGDDGYVGGYTVPEINRFMVKSYKVNKAYYSVSSEEREIGLTGGEYEFDGEYNLSMFPSESVTIKPLLESYFPEATNITYKVGNKKIATVEKDPENPQYGIIVAQEEGTTIVNINVTFNGKSTLHSGRVTITVKDPYTTNAMYLMSYKGLGGTVEIPDDRGITTISAYAFSNYEYVDKDLSAGDVIDEEDPYYIKQMYIGEDTIKKIIIPEGVTTIEKYAFAKLTGLTEVVLPSTLTRIGVGAFLGCTNLKTINLEHVKFINADAFRGCALESLDLVDDKDDPNDVEGQLVAISNYAFADCKLSYIKLPASTQSIAIGSFYNNEFLTSADFIAAKVKIGRGVFSECSRLERLYVNAVVIPASAFENCTALAEVSLGKDVAVIGEYAFAGTSVATFDFPNGNETFTLESGNTLICKGDELVVAAPMLSGTVTTTATSIGAGAFAGNTKIFRVIANNATKIGDYAFSDCTELSKVELNSVTEIGNYAFAGTKLSQTPDLSKVTEIGNYAFVSTQLAQVSIANDTKVGAYAFAYNTKLTTVAIGNGVELGEGVFYCPLGNYAFDPTSAENKYGIEEPYYSHKKYKVYNELGEVVESFDYYYYNYELGVYSALQSLTIGDGVTIGDFAFAGNAKLSAVTLGGGAKIGMGAFFNDAALTTIDLSQAESIGSQAFSGSRAQAFRYEDGIPMFAFEYKYANGELYIVNYEYSTLAPALANVDLTNVTEVAEGAFMNNYALTNITFGANVKEIKGSAFGNCLSLTTVTLPEQLVKVGEYAFYDTALTKVDLSNVDEIGAYAFAWTSVAEAKAKDGAKLADGAFYNCFNLASVQGMDAVSSIGAYAFQGTALTKLTLTKVTEIGDLAFAESKVTEVTFGDQLKTLGENPFYACEIATYGKEKNVEFNGAVVGVESIETYAISDTVQVMNGVLYQAVPKGLELISYPMMKADTDFVIEEGTVRISARAFAGAVLENVTLPSTLLALGDKAFYGCENLSVVVFTSYNAPILEEEYDLSYVQPSNLPMPTYSGDAYGLGITKYHMWNTGTSNSMYFFGANFVGNIGHIPANLVMVRPANGQGYNTFILSQYFGTTVNGVNAATEATVKVIAMIAKLPAEITLTHEALVVAARKAYDEIPSLEQKALVSNYSKLEEAETTIEYLKGRDNPGDDPIVEEPEKEPSGFAKFMKENCVSIIIAGVAIVGSVAFVVITGILRKKKCLALDQQTTNENNNENEEA
ncbi:MAG: leucine-rich repeat protein [Clostridia bacterium]|nr:leucine-rich repeat protein [Clostridia bacterium]